MCPMFGHIMDIFWSHSNHVQNMIRPLDTSSFQKTISWCPKNCPKFGHFLYIFWAYHAYLDMYSNLSVRCPKFIKPLDIFLDIFNRIGRILGTFWTYLRLWTYFGHIMDTFGWNVSKMCPSPHRAGAPKMGLKICKKGQI